MVQDSPVVWKKTPEAKLADADGLIDLHKLEKDGLIEGNWSNEGPRGRRKSYALTEAGQTFASAQRESWRQFIQHFQSAALEEQP